MTEKTQKTEQLKQLLESRADVLRLAKKEHSDLSADDIRTLLSWFRYGGWFAMQQEVDAADEGLDIAFKTAKVQKHILLAAEDDHWGLDAELIKDGLKIYERWCRGFIKYKIQHNYSIVADIGSDPMMLDDFFGGFAFAAERADPKTIDYFFENFTLTGEQLEQDKTTYGAAMRELNTLQRKLELESDKPVAESQQPGGDKQTKITKDVANQRIGKLLMGRPDTKWTVREFAEEIGCSVALISGCKNNKMYQKWKKNPKAVSLSEEVLRVTKTRESLKIDELICSQESDMAADEGKKFNQRLEL